MQGINEKYRQIFVGENQLHNKGLQTNIIRVTKWRKMRWAGYVARMGEGEECILVFGEEK